MKPAEDTPLSALALAVLAADAGLPEDVMTIVTAAQAVEVASVLTASPDVRKLSFTGSTRVGKLLMRQFADTVKKLSLELGGNAPFIVFEDADLDAAVEGALGTKFRNAGQTCVSTNRIYVQFGVMDAFAHKYGEAIRKPGGVDILGYRPPRMGARLPELARNSHFNTNHLTGWNSS